MSTNTKTKYLNRLANEKSPYLLQHADNPVEWYPWGDEAFNKAEREDKPIFLSIGYSTCHWCHVMAHESFENHDVADLMNDVFVSIKVDREERPDIDKIYMTVCQLITNSGGWPLTIIMTPDKKPFFAGTYFPKETRFGRIGMIDLVKRIKTLWKTQKKDLLDSSDKILQALQEVSIENPGQSLDDKVLKNAYSQLSNRFDKNKGGFGNAPKFPSPHNLLLLLRIWKRTEDPEALNMVEKTLKAMRLGGIYDHIGFGFHRYSTDTNWLVPHFEKMLYDQAMLVLAYSEAYQATSNKEYRDTVIEILKYVTRDMTSSEGGFYSAEDADSEGEEGKFYVWTKKEIEQILNAEEAELFNKIYNVSTQGNFLEEATKQKTGNNILHLNLPLAEYSINQDGRIQTLEMMRSKLFKVRDERIRPQRDDKILTDWNGMMIAAFAKAGYILNKPEYIDAAEKAVKFIFNNMMDSNKQLLHRYRGDKADINAFLDDYAFFIWGLLNLYEATFNTKYLEKAIELMDQQLEFFWDSYIGAFFFTSKNGEELLTRQKEIYDGAIPSGNSVSMLNLLRLSQLTGNDEYEEEADVLSRVFAESVRKVPMGHSFLMIGVDYAVGPTYSLVISGDPGGSDTEKMLNSIRKQYLPNKSLLYRPTNEMYPEIDKLSNFIQFFDKYQDKATAYVCINKTCKAPTNSIQQAIEYLNAKK